MRVKTVAALILISLLPILLIMGAVSSGIITVKKRGTPAVEHIEAPGKPENQSSDAGVYVGKLIEGSSYFVFGGDPTVELLFEDNRKFTAPEQLAAEAQMRINGTYRIGFNISDPGVALTIKGVD